VEGDPVRLVQVLTNLLNNAAKYTEPHGEISVRAEPRGGEVRISVRDNGLGVEPEMLPRIFDPFVQGPRPIDRSPGGLGIGLTLVRMLVELHGGRVEARSDGIGRGSEFTVTLPILRRTTAAPARASAPAPAPPASGRPVRILLVEDNPDAAESYALLFGVAGHDVRVARDGLAALRAAEEFVADVAFVDVGLPGIDGYEVARRLRTLSGWANAVLIALSGYGRSEDKAMARDAGFDHHLTKPVEPDVLERFLAQLGRRTDAAPARV